MPSGDRLDMMALLVCIAETGRLAEASRTLGLSQPVASRMLRRLEHSVGVELVRRTTRGLSLTEPGARLVEAGRTILGAWSEATENLTEDGAGLAGPIRIAAPVALGQNLLPTIFAAFMKRHPGVTIDCELIDAQLDLPSRGYDFQLRAGPIDQDTVIRRDLLTVRRSIVARADHPPVEHPAQLADLPAVRIVTFVPPVITLTHEGGETMALRLKTVFSVDNGYAAVTVVRAGIGFAVLPLFITKKLLATGELRELCPAWRPPTVQVSIAYLPTRLRSRRVDALITFLREELTGEGLGIQFLGQEGIRETVTIPDRT